MKNIDISQIVEPTALQPFTANSLKFLQDYNTEDKAAIIKGLVITNLGSYSLTVPYVISGCVVSDSNKDVTSGEIFYGGAFYETTAINGTTNVARFILTKTQDSTADPLIFTDSSSKSVHDIYKYVATDVASGGDFISTDLVSLYGAATVQTSTSAQTTIDVSIVASGPFAYNNDAYNYSWVVISGIVKLNFNITFDVTDGAVVDKIHVPLPTGLNKATVLTATNCFVGTCSYKAPTSTTNYTMLLSRSNDGGSEGQRITLTRTTDGDTDIFINTGVTVTLKGEISFPKG
jgi:hypothetical protein